MAKKFCTSCGTPLTATTRVCPQCGAEGNIPPTVASSAFSAAQPPAGEPEGVPQGMDTSAPAPIPAAAVPTPPAVPPRPKKASQPPVQAQSSMQAQPVYAQPVQAQPVYASQSATPKPKAAEGGLYDMISTGGFVGIFLLLMIPIVGLILMIVWACGGCRKQVKRNFARAMLIVTAIILVLGLVFTLAFRSYTTELLSAIGLGSLNSSGSFAASDLFAMGQTQEPSSGMDMLEGLAGANEGSADSDSPDQLAGLAGLAGLLQGGDLSALEGLEGLENLQGYEELLQGKSGTAFQGGNWPKGLPQYEGGAISGSEENKLYITGASQEGFLAYVEQLKSAGFYFRDFYNMDFNETEMLEYMDAWWGTNDSLWLSMAYYDKSTKEIMEADYDLMIEYYDYNPTA